MQERQRPRTRQVGAYIFDQAMSRRLLVAPVRLDAVDARATDRRLIWHAGA